MRPTTLMLTTLMAGVLAGVAPEISTPIKSAFAPGAASTPGSTGAFLVQLGCPSRPAADICRGARSAHGTYDPMVDSVTSSHKEEI